MPDQSNTETAFPDDVGLYSDSGLLRIATAGSVDDGKSTLIGRLLYDSKQIFQDQLDHIEKTSQERGDSYVNLALLTDGLRAEREQGITIDVAYRYFSTPRREFILADTPGHVQYTRNMVTGASTADVALILIDARNGVIEQSRRHTFIASLLQIPHVVVCVNKMDLIDYDQSKFAAIVEEFQQLTEKLGLGDVHFVPMSALQGDNVVDRSENMDWYQGPALLEYLEELQVDNDRDLTHGRFPVQWVIRPISDEHHDYRGYAGQVAGGVFKPGQEVKVLPSGLTSRIAKIDSYDGEREQAFPPMPATLLLQDDIDISRGDMIVFADSGLKPVRELLADVCWMSDQPLTPGHRYAIKHTTRSARAIVERIEYRVDIDNYAREQVPTKLQLNDIGRIALRISTPLMFDSYKQNRITGSFILIDEATNNTVAAGMVV